MSEKIADEGNGVDLFGDPWTEPKDRRGRKAHRRLPQIAEKIAVLRATGSTEEQVAERIGLDVKTIRKYYSRELEGGPQLIEALLNEAMYAQAMKGRLGAARFVREQLEKGKATLAGQRIEERAKARAQDEASPAAKLGVKEQRQAAADLLAQGGGKYAPPPAPTRLQ